MQLVYLLGVVIAFTSLLEASDEPVMQADMRVLLVGGASVFVTAIAWWLGQLRRHAPASWDGVLSWCEKLHLLAYLGLILLAFPVLKFSQIAHANWRLSDHFLADDLAVAAVLVVPLASSWFCLTTIHEPLDLWSRCRRVVGQIRHFALLPLIPVLFLAAAADAGRYWFPVATASYEGVIGLAVVIGLGVALPSLLRCCWATRPLPQNLRRSRIEQMLRIAGVRVRDILEWDTGGRMANAAIAGFVPSMRYVFVTDVLLQRLDLDEVAAIAAHEAAHCRHGHLRWFAFTLLAPLLALALVGELVTLMSLEGNVSATAAAILILSIWIRAFGRLARQFEHQADLTACQLLGAAKDLHPEIVGHFARALVAVCPNPQGDWLHPAPAYRIALLRRISRDGDSVLDAFHVRLKQIQRRWIAVIGAMAITWLLIQSV